MPMQMNRTGASVIKPSNEEPVDIQNNTYYKQHTTATTTTTKLK
jgi:hypothetical protein